jgi:hypothetical protein
MLLCRSTRLKPRHRVALTSSLLVRLFVFCCSPSSMDDIRSASVLPLVHPTIQPPARGLHFKKVSVRKRSQGFCVVRTQTFVLDNTLKNTLIDTNLCEISEFSTQNAEIPHKFVSINVFFKLSNTKICVLTTQNPCDRFQTHGLCKLS